MTNVWRATFFALSLFVSSSALAVESGWWWNPAQSGRGFSIEIVGTNLFMAGYLYTDDGRATWLVSGGPMTDFANYSGPLSAYRGGQTITGAYQPATVSNPDAGTITLRFTDATHGTLTWPGGTMAIERFVFGTGSSTFLPQTGWWWNPAEGGRGFAIEVQGGTLMMAGYMYDTGGNPLWYVSAGALASPTLYRGSWDQYRDGQTLTGTYKPPTPAGSAGNVTLQFSSPTAATLTLPDQRQIPLSRFAFAPAVTLAPSATLARQCAAPRPAGTLDPGTRQAYGDTQATIANEKSWLRSFVNETYLWYADVPTVEPAPYIVGATVPYVRPSDNSHTSLFLSSNYLVADAYFNSQRSPLATASGKPKDQFHFTYTTDTWNALSGAGQQGGFGFEPALISSTPPREVRIAYTMPDSPATANGLARGALFVSVNGVNVRTGADFATLNEGLFSPVPGKQYTFEVLDRGATASRIVTMTAGTETLAPVQYVGTLPAPNESVGYMLFTDHIATAEGQLVAAVNQLANANNGAGVSDLVLDLRYNGGGLLSIASQLSYMIAGAAQTNGKVFEMLAFSDKNPYGYSPGETATPFYSTTRGNSTIAGLPLPSLNLSRVFVITSSGTCSASESIINGLRGAGINVILIGGTTCGKPYGFFPTDNCSTTYFTIQFAGVNDVGFGAYADGFIPGGTGAAANNLPGCVAPDDFTRALGDPAETRIAAALQYRASGTCPAVTAGAKSASLRGRAWGGEALARPALRDNRFGMREILRTAR